MKKNFIGYNTTKRRVFVMSEFDYVKMLEIPVNSCDVMVKPVKKRKKDVKKQVIEKVNEAVAETVTETKPETIKKQNRVKQKAVKPIKGKKIKKAKPVVEDKSVEIKSSGFDIVSVQVVAIFVLIVGIILTNIFWEDSGINNLMRSVFNSDTALEDVSYTSFTASLPSKTDDVVLENGVMKVSSGSVYSPCDGVVESVVELDGTYTVTIKHSESFSTVVSGLENVYVSKNEKVYSNIPLGYSKNETAVSMFDGDAILTSYVLSENQIVWLG